MSLFDTPTAIWLVTAIHVSGIVGVVLARASEGSRKHVPCLLLFYALLLLVGFAAILATLAQSSVWLVSGFTLGAMMVGATCDFRQRERLSVD